MKPDITEGGKYYIPDISEFHIGFEFEYMFPNGMWFPSVVDVLDSGMYGSNIQSRLALNPPVLRVKFLDHEDIISCGWEEYDGFNSDKKFYIKDNGSIKATMIIHHNIVIEFDSNEWYGKVFRGTIRNKSELLQVMKMIANGLPLPKDFVKFTAGQPTINATNANTGYESVLIKGVDEETPTGELRSLLNHVNTAANHVNNLFDEVSKEIEQKVRGENVGSKEAPQSDYSTATLQGSARNTLERLENLIGKLEEFHKFQQTAL